MNWSVRMGLRVVVLVVKDSELVDVLVRVEVTKKDRVFVTVTC